MADPENPFTVLSTRTVYQNPWIGVTEHRVIKPRGGEGIYGVVHFENRAVGVVPYEAGDIWLVGQYRFPLGAYSWEIPEGGALASEDIDGCARRELTEETGLVADELTPLCTLHLSNSVTDEVGYVFLATGLRSGTASPDETEELAVRRLPLEEAYALVLRGEITDSMSIIAIFRLMLLAREGKLPGTGASSAP